MNPYQSRPSNTGSIQNGPSTSQQLLDNVESAASRFKRAFVRKRPSRAGDELGIQSDAPVSHKMVPTSRLTSLLPRSNPAPTLQFASTTFQALGHRMNKRSPQRVTSQIEMPPEMDYIDVRRPSEDGFVLKSEDKPPQSPTPVTNSRSPYRTSGLVPGPEISAAIEYMFDTSSNNNSPSSPTVNTDVPAERRSSSSSRKKRPSLDKENTHPPEVQSGKRRSMSLSMIPNFQPSSSPPSTRTIDTPPSSFTMGPRPTLPYAYQQQHHRSQSTLPSFPTVSSSTSLSEVNPVGVVNGTATPSTPDKNAVNNFKGKLAAWSSPNHSRSSRGSSLQHTKTSSMVASIAPAATAATGLAVNLSKRAYEKVNSIWSPSGNNSGSGAHSLQGSESSESNYPRGKNRNGHNPYGGSQSDVESTRRKIAPPLLSDQSTGPNLGALLRPPFKRNVQGGGFVFGRPLSDCVRDTKPLIVLGNIPGSDVEARFIPALVLRCVQHIEQWGLQEEGIFRITGRISHVNKLRAEFASGADYDLQTCGPGDLDPHAVASVLKAFLRELPEPVLTRNRLHLFDAAFEKAKDAGFMLASMPGGSLHRTVSSQGTLLSSPSYLSNISSSNLAGNGEGSIPSSSTGELSDSAITPQQALELLIEEFCALVASLPRENRDLLLTISELLNKAAARAQITKMPLSNLLLVLCPSMSINPGVLKILVEHHQGIFVEPLPKTLPSTPLTATGSVQRSLTPDLKVTAAPTVYDQAPQPTNHVEELSERSRTPLSESSHGEHIPAEMLPVRKQSLRRNTNGSQQFRPLAHQASSPSAFKDSFSSTTPPVEGYASLSTSQENLGVSRSSSRPTSPLQQAFSTADMTRPAQPMGPRPPKQVPTPLNLHGSSVYSQKVPLAEQPLVTVTAVSAVLDSTVQNAELPAKQAQSDESIPKITDEPTLQPTAPSLTETTNAVPSLPEMPLLPPMTSTFADRKSPQHQREGNSDNINYNESSGTPVLVSTPATAGSSVQQLTPLLAALEKENTVEHPEGHTTPQERQEDSRETSPAMIAPLVVLKKSAMSSVPQTLRIDSSPVPPESSMSSASSATTDTSNLIDSQMQWPEVPSTLPIVKSLNSISSGQGASTMISSIPGPHVPQVDSSAQLRDGSQVTMDYVEKRHENGSDATASTVDGKFPPSTNTPPISPVVSNGQYPPEPYPSLSMDASTEAQQTLLPLPQFATSRHTVDDDQISLMSNMTMRPSNSKAPRLTVNSKELMASDSYWAQELQRAIQSTGPRENRSSVDLASSALHAA
ncbi:hypothetical protein CPB86DRAFT_811094 [Serendipita vermifera]|nr:hypothetical protein CPB86DRAFT_811094 [Serendipita vermifera]